MVMFSGLNTVQDMRNASRQGKAKKATDKMATNIAEVPAAEKPVTNTSGTAKSTRGDSARKQTQKQIAFGAQMAGPGKATGLGVMAGFLGMPFTKRMGGSVMTVDTRNQEVVRPGTPLKANKNATIGGFPISPTTAKKKPTTGTGIDAPEPDTGWRPSGTNSALGLQQTEMGVPLQETIGVSKRKR